MPSNKIKADLTCAKPAFKCKLQVLQFPTDEEIVTGFPVISKYSEPSETNIRCEVADANRRHVKKVGKTQPNGNAGLSQPTGCERAFGETPLMWRQGTGRAGDMACSPDISTVSEITRVQF